MPPIPIYKNAPINPLGGRPDGVTPSTTIHDAENPSPTRTTPAYAPVTTTQDSSNPPLPQPGARPAAPTSSSQGYNGPSSPPAPQPGPTVTFVTTETRLGGLPLQFTRAPPSDSMLAGRSTTTNTEPSNPGPTTLNYGPAASPFQAEDIAPTRHSLEHPPGYTQAHVPGNSPYKEEGQGDSDEGGVGVTAWNILSKAGEALKKGEEAAWKAVRNN